MKLWLSQYITEGLNGWPNKPNNILRSQMASQLARLAAIYSASAELNATECCFRRTTTPLPNPTQNSTLKCSSYQKHNLPNQNQCNLPISLHLPAYNPDHTPLYPVHPPGLTHELAHRVDYKTYIWSSVDEIHQGTNQLSIQCGIHQLGIWSMKLLLIGDHRCQHGSTILHVESVKDVHNILPLPQKQMPSSCHTSKPKK